MSYVGPVLYLLLLVFAAMIWKETRGRSLDDMLARIERHHRHLRKVLDRHPNGGSWKRFSQWMEEEKA